MKQKDKHCGLHIHKSGYKSYYDMFYDYIINQKIYTLQVFYNSPYSLQNLNLIDKEEVNMINQLIKKEEVHLYCHTGYLINLSSDKKTLIKLNLENIYYDCVNIYNTGGIGIILHNGKSVNLSYSEALTNYVNNIKKLISMLKKNKIKIQIIIENSAHQGTELGYDIRQLAEIYRFFTKSEQKWISFCLDSCHLYASGYDITNSTILKKVFKEFDKLIGLNKLIVCHINDSKNQLGSRVDRHANILHGTMKKDIDKFVKYCHKLNIPMILETPDKNKQQVELLRSM